MGKPGPSGDPVRLFKNVLYLFSHTQLTAKTFLLFDLLNSCCCFFFLNLYIQGQKSERGDKGDPGEKGEQVSLLYIYICRFTEGNDVIKIVLI